MQWLITHITSQLQLGMFSECIQCTEPAEGSCVIVINSQ